MEYVIMEFHNTNTSLLLIKGLQKNWQMIMNIWSSVEVYIANYNKTQVHDARGFFKRTQYDQIISDLSIWSRSS